jgi:hypothetical protein
VSYRVNNRWSVDKIQPIAIKKVYNKMWPNATVIELDNDTRNILKSILDRSGSDKLIRFQDGTIAFLGQRFRRHHNTKGYDDFTLRVWNYKTGANVEFKKILSALEHNRNIANYYSYGHVNEKENGFDRFRIIDFPKFLKLVVDKKLLPDQRRQTNSGDAEFLCWRFSRIPKSCLVFDTTEKITLSKFFG